MDLSLRSREEIRRYIKAIPKAEWPAQLLVLSRGFGEARRDGHIDEATYQILGDEIDARRQRHTVSAVEDHDRFEGRGTHFESVNSAISDLVGSIKKPPEPKAKPIAPLAPSRPRRGRWTVPVEDRSARRKERMRQAKLAKCPAEVLYEYKLAQASAFSIVLYDIYQHGECTRSVAHIAGSAGTSERTVQSMLRQAHDRRDLMVEYRTCPDTRRTIPSRVTTLSAEILDYQKGLREPEPTTPLENRSFYNSDRNENRGPHRGAKLITLFPTAEPEAEQEVPPEAAEDQPDFEPEAAEVAVLDVPEPSQDVIDLIPDREAEIEEFEDQEPEPETVDEPLPPEPKPLLAHRPSWQPKMSMEEWERLHPKPPRGVDEVRESIDDKLAASLALVRGHTARTQVLDEQPGHKIEQPDAHGPMNDRWAKIAAEVEAHVHAAKREPKRDEPS